MSTQFAMTDTTRADGVYVDFSRIIEHDDTAGIDDIGCGEDGEPDAEREASYLDDEWHFVGVRARARVTIVRNGVGTLYVMLSPGLWGIESDSGEAYFDEVYAEQCEELRSDIEQLRALPVSFADPVAA